MWIRQLGPIKHLWTLRCEAQHSVHKTVIRHLGNFKNVVGIQNLQINCSLLDAPHKGVVKR